MDKLSQEQIIQIAEANGLHTELMGQSRLVDQGDGTMRFVRSTQLSYYGEKLIAFAEAIEAEVRRG